LADFFTRVTAGLLFGMAGPHKAFIMTPQVRARKLFLEPHHLDSTIPFVATGASGFLFSSWRRAGGWLPGYLRRPVAISLGFLLLMLTYGHALRTLVQCEFAHLRKAHFAAADSRSLRVVDNPWSIDGMVAKRKREKTV
jgi:hypothetical protein